MHKVLLRYLTLISILAGLCIIFPQTTFAQVNTINYSNANLENRDFSYTDFVGGTFVAAEMRGTIFPRCKFN